MPATTLNSLSPAVLHLVLLEVSLTSSKREILQLAVVAKSWTHSALSVLYDAITLASDIDIEAFTLCKTRLSYRTTTLSLVKEWLWTGLLRADPADLDRLLDSLPVPSRGEEGVAHLFIDGRGDDIKPDFLDHPAFSGLESLRFGDSITLAGSRDKKCMPNLREVVMPSCGYSEVLPVQTPMLRRLDLHQILYQQYSSETYDRLEDLYPYLPLLTHLILPSIDIGFDPVEGQREDWDVPEKICNVVQLSTSLLHLTLSFNSATTSTSREEFLRKALPLVSLELVSLTLRKDESSAYFDCKLDDRLVRVLREFLDREDLRVRRLRMVGVQVSDFRAVEGGAELFEVMDRKAIQFLDE